MHEYFSYNFRPVITGDTKRFDIDLDVLNDSGQICFLDVQLFKTCWRTNFFKPLLKRNDAVVAVKNGLNLNGLNLLAVNPDFRTLPHFRVIILNVFNKGVIKILCIICLIL